MFQQDNATIHAMHILFLSVFCHILHAHYWLVYFKYGFKHHRKSMKNTAKSCTCWWKTIKFCNWTETSDFAWMPCYWFASMQCQKQFIKWFCKTEKYYLVNKFLKLYFILMDLYEFFLDIISIFVNICTSTSCFWELAVKRVL